MTILHAGGKFDNSAYKVSGGLHGVGVSVVNALSKKMNVQVRRDGKVFEMEFSRGKTTQKMKEIADSPSTGTTVTFWPDEEIFETTVYDYDILHDRLQQTAFLNKNLKIVLTDERESTPHVEEFCYEGGIIDFVKFLNEGKDVPDGLKSPIYLSGASEEGVPVDKTGEVEVAIQWNTSYSETVMSFANDIRTIEGGMHMEGFRAALTSVINEYARKNAIIKEKEGNLTGDDIREGLTAVVSVEARRPAVRGSDQGQARQLLHAHPYPQDRLRGPGRLSRGASQAGTRDHQEGAAGEQGPQRRSQGPRGDAPQIPAGDGEPPRQARRLLGPRARDDRALHRRG